ncbi:germination protein YpeB [Halobacillus andaensis]|uniref:Germination protein YpeB n=1 Tax=Halobacillus andaensis TaxID=1176239 RepID=A0A917AZ27_HALAA|nr:germination protein YpeB [Halobacillus andaensis]MBP2003250.1 spore germination protein [Halobacillus andaensis]GGF09234.1 germination protein YpeB [Halobacillus andaensis]
MFRWITISLLTLLVVGVAVFAYKEHQDKNAILIQAENSYQRAFHELTSDVDTLHDKIGATLAMNTRKQLSPQMAEIWRITSEASSDVGQLPLTLLPFNKTEEFLFDIGDFAYNTAIRDLDKEPLSEEEIAGLEELYKQSGDIKNELRKVQNMVLKDNLRWMDVELALATNDETGDNTIINGFKTVEKSMDGFQQTNMETGISSRPDEKDLSHLKGEKINKDKAIQIAQEWFGEVEPSEFTITDSGKGADIPTVTASFHKDKRNGYMDMSKQGGYPLTIMVARDVEETKISLNEASNKAKEYVDKLELKDMELIESSQYDNVGVFRYVYTEDDIRYYPSTVQVKVALDNGEMLGLDALQYYSRPNESINQEPSLSEEEAKEMINPNLEVQENYLAVIENDAQELVLCYEFLTTKDDETYRIFINADNGEEEKVETLNTSEEKFTTDIS